MSVARSARAALANTDSTKCTQIAIRTLLNHTGGWDRDKPNEGFDPMGVPAIAASAVNAPAPASSETVIRYMKGMLLDVNPGETFAYSNFGDVCVSPSDASRP